MKDQLRACLWGVGGAAVGWSLVWLLQDIFGLHSLIYPDDGWRMYAIGFGAISGYAAARWGWVAMLRMTEDWQDTFGPYPQAPDDHSSREDCGRPGIALQESKAEIDSQNTSSR